MKYVILIGDGMADYEIAELGNKTPLDYAHTPNLDRLAGTGKTGLFATVPPGFSPGSDVANLSVLGYDPRRYYTGRAPLEAASIGVKLEPTDVAFRCNLVTLVEKDSSHIMDDYSSGHISTEDAREIVLDLDKAFKDSGVRFYPGTSYRHLMVFKGGNKDVKTTPPHDISDKPIDGHLPKGAGSEMLIDLMKRSWEVLKNHPVNERRFKAGKKRATSIWLWGQGVAPSMPTYTQRFGVDGAIISAVDLMKGIGIYAGLEVINVPGATGYIDTNYKGKAEAALAALEKKDFVCVHVEAPDEAGHNGNLKDKLTAIEDFDREIVGKVVEGLARFGDYRLLVLPDHPTPIRLKTHSSDPVPFILSSSEDMKEGTGSGRYNEKEAAQTGLLIDDCAVMIEDFFGRPEQVCDLK